ncbi:hypothetical protein EIP86_008466 [Pleurotus ostreatoroseus]|nr:hypothetical protein EIP86_008466 [Pleurotus ostreatoroseus]
MGMLQNSAYVVDEADPMRCIVLDVGGARFRVRYDRLCAHSMRIRGMLSQSATSLSVRVRSQSEASDRTKVGAASEGMSDMGYDSETGHEVTGIRKVEGSVHGDEVADGEHIIAHHSVTDQSSAEIQGQTDVKDVAFELAIEDVNPADFREMLGAMDDAIAFVLRPPAPHTLACILRAAHALSCTDLVTFTKACLLEVWSPNLHSLDLHSLSPTTSVSTSDALEVIGIARAHDVSGVLKRAFYELLRVPRDAGHELDAWDALDASDKDHLHTAHGELQMAWAGLVWTMPNHRAFQCHAPPSTAHAHAVSISDPVSHSHDYTPSTDGPLDAHVDDASSHPAATTAATDPPLCTAQTDGPDRFQTWRDLLESLDLFAPPDPLDGLRRLAELDWTARGFCDMCSHERAEIFARKREELWAKLDGWLGLCG